MKKMNTDARTLNWGELPAGSARSHAKRPNLRVPQGIVLRAAMALCKSVDSPHSLALHACLAAGDHASLLTLGARPSDYDSPDQFRKDYLVDAFLKKFKGLKTGIDTKAAALRAFYDAEAKCKLTNDIFRAWEQGVFSFHPAVERVLHAAKRKISYVLSPLFGADGHVDFEKLTADCRWGPGATASLKATYASVAHKVREDQIAVTAGALPLLRRVMSDDYHWLRARGIDAEGPVCLLQSEFSVVNSSRVVVVDKNAKTGRTINAEPTGNILLQLGAGSAIRKCLLRVGIDLDTQGNNQYAARAAYRDGLATVDLKGASDSISRELVWQLLPLDIAIYLDLLRTPNAAYKGENIRLQKWSAMGNGYTFELETLVFWALAESVSDLLACPSKVWVYGDDIILDASGYPLLREVLHAVGFETNVEKTFASGYFYESCGKHFFKGVDVTPVYQQDEVVFISDFIPLVNRLYRYVARQRCPHTYAARRVALSAAPWVADWFFIPDRQKYGYSPKERDQRLLEPHSSEVLTESDAGVLVPFANITKPLSFGSTDGTQPHWGWKFPVLAFTPSKEDEATIFGDHSASLCNALRLGSSELATYGQLTERRRGRWRLRYRQFRVD